MCSFSWVVMMASIARMHLYPLPHNSSQFQHESLQLSKYTKESKICKVASVTPLLFAVYIIIMHGWRVPQEQCEEPIAWLITWFYLLKQQGMLHVGWKQEENVLDGDVVDGSKKKFELYEIRLEMFGSYWLPMRHLETIASMLSLFSSTQHICKTSHRLDNLHQHQVWD